MGLTVRRLSSQSTPVLQDSDVKLSLSNKKEIKKKVVVDKGSPLVRDGIHVKLSELRQGVSIFCSFISEKCSFLKLLISDNCNGTGTT